jgi:hypothetical protein
MHIAIICPLIMYLVLKRKTSNDKAYILLGVIGVFTFIYHLSKFLYN